MAKNTYGTGCFLLMNTGETPIQSKNGLLTTIAWGLNGHVNYALEGSVFVGGAVIQWLRDELGLIENAAQSEEFARKVPDSGGVYVVPAFVGLGAPYWDPYARGTISGLTRGSNRFHIVRAALESIAYQVSDLLEAMRQDAGVREDSLLVDGGASANDFLMQFQADLIRAEVRRPKEIETTSLGAAYLAGLAVGYWRDKADILENQQSNRIFVPSMEEQKRRLLLDGWREAVSRSIAYKEESKF